MSTPTSKDAAKRASMAFKEIPADAGEAPKVAATVMMQTKALGEVYYFIQVVCEKDQTKGHFLRTYEDFVALDARVRDSAKSMGGVQFYGEAASLRAIVELPKAEKFGFRRRVSQLGLTDYNSERSQQLQGYLNSMLSQLPRLRDEPILAEWFGEDAAVLQVVREPAVVAKLKFLAKHLTREFSPRTPEACEAEPIYKEGYTVRIVGLQNTTEFNNMIGTVLSHDVDVEQLRKSMSGGASPLETSAMQTGRYRIQMMDGQTAKAKAINVRIAATELSDADLALAVQPETGSSTPKRASIAAMLGLSEA